MTMSFSQYLRAVWSRKWLALFLFVVVAAAGSAVVRSMPNAFTAEASLVVDVRPDPILGPLATPIDIATQVEIFKSDKVATRAVQLLGMDKDPKALEQWRQFTDGKKIPLERFFAGLLQRSLTVEPVRLSNVISVTFTSPDAAFSAAAANAFAQAAIDTSIELKAEPAKQSAEWFEKRSKELRVRFEQAQANLTKYQQAKGIIISDGQMDQETARLNLLTQQLADAQATQAGIMLGNSTDSSPDVMASSSVLTIKSQLSVQESLLSEKAGVWGPNHPERISAEARIATLQKQLATESGRVRSGSGTMVATAAKKVALLSASIEQQKKKVLALRFERDNASVLLRDVESAQKAYEESSKHASDYNAGGDTKDASLRLLSRAVEPFATSRKKLFVGMAASIIAGLLLAIGVPIGLEILDRRIRSAEDMSDIYGVPVIAVLRPEGSRLPTYRQMTVGPDGTNRPNVPLIGVHR